MHDPERDIRDIPLSQLELSPGNVRKTPADASAFTELKASIAAHGLLENLITRSMGPGPDGAARYEVIAGGRRLAAMQALAAEGALDEDNLVPCRMIGGIVAAEEVSLAENSVRAAMHPADQVEAFRRLADAGSTAAAIAARFGVSERTVEKRLRLGNAAPVLLETYRAGGIDLETLMAFAVTTDQAHQSAVWETVSQQGYRPGAWQIKRLLTEDRVPATSAIARFVGLEAYEAVGGRINQTRQRRPIVDQFKDPHLEPAPAHLANLQSEVPKRAADVALRVAQLLQHELAVGEQHPPVLARHRLHMHRPDHVHPNHLRDPARVVAVALVHRRRQHRLQLPRLGADHRQAGLGQALVEPLRQRPRLETDAGHIHLGLGEERHQSIRLAQHLRLPDDLSVTVNHANARPFQ